MRHARATPAFREHAISRQRAFQIGKLAMLSPMNRSAEAGKGLRRLPRASDETPAAEAK
jgi:hypothetical protein